MKSHKLYSPKLLNFDLRSPFPPGGDQPQAIAELIELIKSGNRYQTLKGITGSGKTFTIANVVAQLNRPVLVIAPNKTLAAQLYGEFKEFFPEAHVSYFVSYYDYFQPEAYIPSTDTYIEKDSAINDEIDKMRHRATRAVLEYSDTIVVASVSCIYGLGAPEDYFDMMVFLETNQNIDREGLITKLVEMQYKRAEVDFTRGSFRVRGETLDIFPSDEDSSALRITLFGDDVEDIREIDPITGATLRTLDCCAVYPVSHFVTSKERVMEARKLIKKELKSWLPELRNQGKALEAQRLEQRTLYDLELLKEVGFCPGIENYSRHMTARPEGEPPATLLDYFTDDFILVIDESHVTVPQLGAMYKGDRSRKQTLVDYGFRLPSALDNRPLKADEFWERTDQVVFVSATPGDFELEKSADNLINLINRPTGLLDPPVEVRPAKHQVDDLIGEIHKTLEQGNRVLVTTLTKKMAEDLSVYLREIGIKCAYLHADIKTIERVDIIRSLRKGDIDVLIGINLLREGLDLVEVALVAILDADKEGFLRSGRSLIQTMGRAARNLSGRVIMYADRITDSMRLAIDEVEKRRSIQQAYNQEHGVIPRSAERGIEARLGIVAEEDLSLSYGSEVRSIHLPSSEKEQKDLLESLQAEMMNCAKAKEFERAAEIRDVIKNLKEKILALGSD